MRSVFVGPGGIRAGWRLLIFFAILSVEFVIAGAVVSRIFPQAGAVQRQTTLLPATAAAFSGLTFLLVVIAAYVMSKIESRPFGVYGLGTSGTPPNERFGHGAAAGFISISLVLFVMFLLHGFRIDGIATHGGQLFAALCAWAAAFVLVGFSEEFAFRGYVQYTLTTGIGFWAASVVTTLLFTYAHTRNAGESPMGIFEVALFAIVFCFVLFRTGNLWWGIGYHAAWDFGETCFYGVPDSGLRPWHPFLATSSHGPVWLTGGSVGPEGSVLTIAVLLLTALYVARVYPRKTYSTGIVSTT